MVSGILSTDSAGKRGGRRTKKTFLVAVESLEPRLALAGISAGPMLHLGDLTPAQHADAMSDRAHYLESQRSLHSILTDGQWLSTHRDINTFEGGTVKSVRKVDGNNYTFSSASPTQLTARNSYVLSDASSPVYTVNWVVQVNPLQDTFILRDPTTPEREAHGRYDRKTDTMVLLINGPAGSGAQPTNGPAWGITTNYYTHVRGGSGAVTQAAGDPIMRLSQLTRAEQRDAHRDVTAYLAKQRALRKLFADGQWVSTHRDINVHDAGNRTSITKTDGNNYRFSVASSTQLAAVNSYALSDADPTIYKVNWMVQVDPFRETIILRDPATPSREAQGRYDRKTDTMVLMINGPAGPGAEPSRGPAWGITTNYYTHVRGGSRPVTEARGEPILRLAQLTGSQRRDAHADTARYLRKQQAMQSLLADGQWMSTHRDINVFEGGNVTSTEKFDGNNHTFSVASPTQLGAVNSYLLGNDVSTVYTVNWTVQIDPFVGGFIMRDPTTPTREVFGRYDSRTDTFVLTINGPAGSNAQPSSGPAWGITTNYYTHVRTSG
jgi:hypothetical protein